MLALDRTHGITLTGFQRHIMQMTSG